MLIAILSPVSRQTPTRHHGPWESVVSLLTEALVHMGLDATLFATGDSKNGICTVSSTMIARNSYSVVESRHRASEVFHEINGQDSGLLHRCV